MSSHPTPIAVKPSAHELSNSKLSQRNLEIAMRALAQDGLVVLEDLVDFETLDKLNDKMVQDAYHLQSRKDSPFNYNKGNIQQDPPMTAEWFHGSIYANPIITQVTSTCLGPRPVLRFISGNTALPPTAETPPASQPTHNDADFDHVPVPFALVVNVPLVTMTPENGSTGGFPKLYTRDKVANVAIEIWLGTHSATTIADQEGAHGERASGRIKPDLLETRRAVRGPCQPVIKKGSIVVRDLRLWHGGKPNYSTEPRVMLAMIHFASWYRNQMSVELAEELEEQLDAGRTGFQAAATYVSHDQLLQNYLSRPYGNAYDFNQTEKIEGVF